jgi:putative DNA primase/helicase
MQRNRRDDLEGRWRGILTAAGVSSKLLDHRKHHPCPFCGGKDRFRFSDHSGKGRWFCNQCKPPPGGDGYEFLQAFKGIDFKEAAKLARSLAGVRDPAPPAPDMGKLMRDRRRLWESATDVSASSPVGKYLTRRCRIVAFPRALREVRTADGWEMLALIMDPAGKGKAIHRTPIDDEGNRRGKRLYMPGPLPKGGAVRLCDAKSHGVLGIAEGIETAISAMKLFRIPVWAALDVNALSNWAPPEGVGEVVAFADNDEHGKGQLGALQLGARLLTQRPSMGFSVEMPIWRGMDWNDMHNGKQPEHITQAELERIRTMRRVREAVMLETARFQRTDDDAS